MTQRSSERDDFSSTLEDGALEGATADMISAGLWELVQCCDPSTPISEVTGKDLAMVYRAMELAKLYHNEHEKMHA